MFAVKTQISAHFIKIIAENTQLRREKQALDNRVSHLNNELERKTDEKQALDNRVNHLKNELE